MTRDDSRGPLNNEALIEMLRSTNPVAGPPLRVGPATVEAAGRRVRRRRQIIRTASSGVALAIVPILGVVAFHGVSAESDTVLFPATAANTDHAPAGSAEVSSRSLAAPEQAAINREVLRSALGSDFTFVSRSRAGQERPFGEELPPGTEMVESDLVPPGDVTASPGTTTNDLLPKDYANEASLWVADPRIDPSLKDLCQPMEEKGLSATGCSEYTLPDGSVYYVQRMRAEAADYKPGAWDGDRIMFVQPGGSLVVADIAVHESAANSTEERQAVARKWLEQFTTKLASAASDPRVAAPRAEGTR